MADEHWNHDRQAAIRQPPALPSSVEVPQHAARLFGMLRAQMLEEQIQEGLLRTEAGGEEQVAVAVGEVRIDERAGLVRERAPIDGREDRLGEDATQQPSRMGRMFERCLEKRIVRPRCHAAWVA
jgi:hypothetical protein